VAAFRRIPNIEVLREWRFSEHPPASLGQPWMQGLIVWKRCPTFYVEQKTGFMDF